MIKSAQQNINGWMTHLMEESKFNISVDCVIFGYNFNELQVLLMECDFPLYKGKWSLVGDLLKQNETINDAAQRILFEAYYSLINTFNYQFSHPSHLKLEWVNVRDITELAFDHKMILDACQNTLKKQMRLSSIAFDILPEKFSFMQLQRLYETVLNVNIDKRNFRRRMNKLGYLIDVGETQDAVSHRPAKLYRFDREKYLTENDGTSLSFMI